MHLRVPRSALLGAASLLGALAAFATARVFPYQAPPPPRAASPRPSIAAPPPQTRWPRPLPRDPERWMTQLVADCGLKVAGSRSEAHATTFPTPSGGSVVLWEYTLRLTAEGQPDEVRSLMARLGRAPCAVHVPELDLTWLPGGRVRLYAQTVLLGALK